jgi:hypothetical protein
MLVSRLKACVYPLKQAVQSPCPFADSPSMLCGAVLMASRRLIEGGLSHRRGRLRGEVRYSFRNTLYGIGGPLLCDIPLLRLLLLYSLSFHFLLSIMLLLWY